MVVLKRNKNEQKRTATRLDDLRLILFYLDSTVEETDKIKQEIEVEAGKLFEKQESHFQSQRENLGTNEQKNTN